MPNDVPNPTYTEADASNTAAVPNGCPEGWFPSDVNNWGRQVQGAVKRFWDHLNPTETTTGTSTAYVLTYDVAPQQYWDGEIYAFIVGTTCGASPTLNVNALGAKGLRKFVGTSWVAVAAGELVAGQKAGVAYNLADDKFDLIFRSSSDAASLSGDNAFTGMNSFADTVTMIGAAFNNAVRVTMASASSMAIGAAASNWLRFTGTATINGFDTVASGVERDVLFVDAMTLVDGANLHLCNNGSNIVTADGDSATFKSAGAGVWYCTSYQRVDGTALRQATGSIVARAYSAYTSFTTITANIPADDSIPQVGEGTQILSASITPKATANRIRATVQVPIGLPPATSGLAAAALFRNGASNAISSVFIRPTDGTGTYPAVITFEDSPGSTSAQTYTVRVGGDSQDIVVNGDFSGRLGGGTSRATIVLEEIVT